MFERDKKFNESKVILFLAIIFLLFGANEVEASGNVYGWMWFQNIEYVSLNKNGLGDIPGGGGNQEYGVDIGTDGKLTGYAWSSNIGWINFNPDADNATYSECGFPGGFCHSACVNLPGQGVGVCDGEGANDYTVTGWIRACSVFKNGCSGPLSPNAGDWDGWIKLENVWIDASVSPAEFHYWAWGGSFMGWGTFNCSDGSPNGGDACGSSNYKAVTNFLAQCGSAAREYQASENFNSFTFCASGNPDPNPPAFPTVSNPSYWICTTSQ